MGKKMFLVIGSGEERTQGMDKDLIWICYKKWQEFATADNTLMTEKEANARAKYLRELYPKNKYFVAKRVNS